MGPCVAFALYVTNSAERGRRAVQILIKLGGTTLSLRRAWLEAHARLSQVQGRASGATQTLAGGKITMHLSVKVTSYPHFGKRCPMKTFSPLFPVVAALALVAVAPLHAVQPWRQVTVPTVAEAAASFPNPPSESGAIHWAIWGGQQTKARIIADIDRIHENGGTVYMINNSRGVKPTYLSPEYMDLVKTVVQQCKKSGMKVWIEGDCGYPDGFAGGLISKDYPLLGMQGIIADAHCTVAAGKTLDIPLPADTLGILANPPVAASRRRTALDSDGQVDAAAGRRQVQVHGAAARGVGRVIVQFADAEVRYNMWPGEPFIIPVQPGTKGIYLAGSGGGGGGGGRGRRTRRRTGAGAAVGPRSSRCPRTASRMDGARRLGLVGAHFHPPRLQQLAHPQRQRRRRRRDQGRLLLADRLSRSGGNRHLPQGHPRSLREGGRRRVRQDHPRLPRRRDRLHRFQPWTPKLLETFQEVEGLRPASPTSPRFFGGPLTPEAQRAKADYWDVWSGMFRDNFYKPMEDWCTARNMEYMLPSQPRGE